MAAAGVNRPDLMQRQGKYPPPPGATDIPGLEVAGRIAALGPDDATDRRARERAGWQIGDGCARSSPAAATPNRARRPRRPVPAGSRRASRWSRQRRCPKRSSPSGPTCSSADGWRAARWLLVHGGTSGIGTTAIQLGRRSRRPRVRHGRIEGEVPRRAEQSRRDARRSITGTRTWSPSVNGRHGRPRRRRRPRHGRRRLHAKKPRTASRARAASCRSRTMGGRRRDDAAVDGDGEAADDHRIHASAAHAGGEGRDRRALSSGRSGRSSPSGRVRPVVERTFPLADAAAAHRALENGEVIGKVILQT